MTLADKMSTRLSDPIKSQPKQDSRQINLVLHMPEVSGLIRHLDMLYTKLLINNSQQQQSQQPMVEILGKPYIQTRSWFNPGQGIKQSAAVQ